MRAWFSKIKPTATRLKKLWNSGNDFLWHSISRRTVGELVWLVTGQALSTLLGLVTIKLLTKIGPAQYGVYALAVSIAAFLSITAFGPFEQGFLRYYHHYASKGGGAVYVKIGFKVLLGVMAALAAFACLISLVSIPFKLELSPLVVLVIGLFAIVSAASSPVTSVLNLLRKRKENTILQAVEKAVVLVGLLVLYFTHQLTLEYAVILTGVAAAGITWFRLKRIQAVVDTSRHQQEDGTRGLGQDILAKVWQFGWPFAVWGIAGWLQANSDRWAVLATLSADDVGKYAVIASVASFLIVMPYGILAQLLTPVIYEKLAKSHDLDHVNDGYKYIRLFVILVAVLTCIAAVLTAVYGKQLVLLVSNEDYVEHAAILPWLSIGVGLFYIGQALCVFGMAAEKPQKYLWPKLSAGMIAVGGNVALVYVLGVSGIAVSACMVGAIYVIWILWANRKIRAQVSHVLP